MLTAWVSARRSPSPPSIIWVRTSSWKRSRLSRRRKKKKRRRRTRPWPRRTVRSGSAIVGRPNVGKSSLFNHILGEERSLTGPEPGLTRDSIAAPWDANGRAILLHDTAGLRRSARAAGQTLEQLSIASTLDAIRFADCVIVVIDATQPFEKQDLTIADLIEKEGRAVVFAINKWDIVEDRAGAITKLRRQLDESLPQLVGAPLVAISARTGEGIDRLLRQ